MTVDQDPGVNGVVGPTLTRPAFVRPAAPGDEALLGELRARGLFTPAAARPVLSVAWSEITTISVTNAHAGQTRHVPRRLAHSVVKVATMRLDLPDQLVIETPAWTMTIGVRVSADELTSALRQLLSGCDGPTPVLTAP